MPYSPRPRRPVRAHVHVAEGAPQAVVDYAVDQLPVAHPVAPARPGKQVGRVAHRLHAAGHHHVGIAGPDQRVGQVHRPEAGRADLVDGRRHDPERQPGLVRGLPRADLARAGLHHLAHQHLVDLLRPLQELHPAHAPREWPLRPGRSRTDPSAPPGRRRTGCGLGADDDGFPAHVRSSLAIGMVNFSHAHHYSRCDPKADAQQQSPCVGRGECAGSSSACAGARIRGRKRRCRRGRRFRPRFRAPTAGLRRAAAG